MKFLFKDYFSLSSWNTCVHSSAISDSTVKKHPRVTWYQLTCDVNKITLPFYLLYFLWVLFVSVVDMQLLVRENSMLLLILHFMKVHKLFFSQNF